MKVSHEVLSCLFEESREFNDFDYALAHLVLENENYANFYRNQSRLGREVWLDNSIFEKGKSLSIEDIIKAKELIKPTHVIVPDVLKDMESTIYNYRKYNKAFRDVRTVGVVQGKTEAEMVKCYEFFKDTDVDVIAIPFDIDVYDEYLIKDKKRFILARQMFVSTLIAKGIIDKDRYHHLLGCVDPIEFPYYRQFSYIRSVDTSSPIMHGYYKQRITKEGLEKDKPSMLLADVIDTTIDEEQKNMILKNVEMFKYFM